MGKNVSAVNVFDRPYQVWSKRKTTYEEALELVRLKGIRIIEAFEVNDKLIEEVSTHTEAASYMLRVGADNGLEGHVDRALDDNAEYRRLREQMSKEVPGVLRTYQGSYPEYDQRKVDGAINTHGVSLAEGQVLFHGGRWPSGGEFFTTSRPFSTSFCPQVALRNAEWRGKAYDAGRVDLMVVRVTQPTTMAYAYGREGDHGNEKEIVFASGAHLKLVRETYIADIPTWKFTSNMQEKKRIVPAYVVEIEIS